MNYPKRHNDEKLWRYRVGDPNHRHIWISSVQFSSVAQSCPALCNPMNHSTPGLAITNPRSLLKFMSIESVMPSSHLILCCPLILPPIPPSIRVFSNESTVRMRCRSFRVSALTSILPMNTQDWFPLVWTSWISLLSKGLSRVFSNTTLQKHQFFGTQLSSQSNSHIHTWPLEKLDPWLDGPLLAK